MDCGFWIDRNGRWQAPHGGRCRRLLAAGAAAAAALGAALALAPPLPADEPPRWFVNTFWTAASRDPDFDRLDAHLRLCRERGLNAVSFDVSWAAERDDGSWDFANADRLADLALARGLRLFVRLNTSFQRGAVPAWAADEHRMRRESGAVYDAGRGGTAPAIAHPFVREKMRRFYTAAARRFRERYGGRPDGGPVVCYSGAFSEFLESEYSLGADLDYSPASRDAFRAWLAGRAAGRTVAELNAQWGTSVGRLEELDLREAPRPLRELFFAHTLDALFAELKAALREGDPGARFGMQSGCLWDFPARHSMLVDLRSPAIDWIFVADAPDYPFAFTLDFLRASARGKRVSNEIDGPYLKTMSPDAPLRQGRVSFEHGADAVFLCNWSFEALADRAAWPFPEALGRAAHEPKPDLRPSKALVVSTWDLVDGVGRTGEYQAAHDRLSGGGKEAVDVLNDCGVRADADRLSDYAEVVLPYNRTIAGDVRKILDRLPKGKLRILKPELAGTRDEFGRATPPVAGGQIETQEQR